jgi:hypothetical protein
MRYPFTDPMDAPTMRSGGGISFDSTLHAPACHAPNIPPPDNTSARMKFDASQQDAKY